MPSAQWRAHNLSFLAADCNMKGDTLSESYERYVNLIRFVSESYRVDEQFGFGARNEGRGRRREHQGAAVRESNDPSSVGDSDSLVAFHPVLAAALDVFEAVSVAGGRQDAHRMRNVRNR